MTLDGPDFYKASLRGVATFRDRSRYRADHFAGASSEGHRMPLRDPRSPPSLD